MKAMRVPEFNVSAIKDVTGFCRKQRAFTSKDPPVICQDLHVHRWTACPFFGARACRSSGDITGAFTCREESDQPRRFQHPTNCGIPLHEAGIVVSFRPEEDGAGGVEKTERIEFRATGSPFKWLGWRSVGPGMDHTRLLGAEGNAESIAALSVAAPIPATGSI